MIIFLIRLNGCWIDQQQCEDWIGNWQYNHVEDTGSQTNLSRTSSTIIFIIYFHFFTVLHWLFYVTLPAAPELVARKDVGDDAGDADYLGNVAENDPLSAATATATATATFSYSRWSSLYQSLTITDTDAA